MGPSDQTLCKNALSGIYNLMRAWRRRWPFLYHVNKPFTVNYIYQSKSATAAVHIILSCGHVFILWLKISILFTRTQLYIRYVMVKSTDGGATGGGKRYRRGGVFFLARNTCIHTVEQSRHVNRAVLHIDELTCGLLQFRIVFYYLLLD